MVPKSDALLCGLSYIGHLCLNKFMFLYMHVCVPAVTLRSFQVFTQILFLGGASKYPKMERAFCSC